MIWKQRTFDKDKEQKLLSLGQKKIIARILAQREIEPDKIPFFLANDYDKLTHPHKLKGLKEAVDIFCQVVKNKGTIGVTSDYDTDGIIAASMIKELCNIFKINCFVFLPDRSAHGYGLSEKSIESMKNKFKSIPDLLFVLDSGTNSEKELVEIKKHYPSIKIVIIDHHLVNIEKMSKSADVLINWHLQDDYSETCTCGEVFQFIRGIRWLTKKVNPIEFLSYAAIGILADVSPVIGDNRIIVKHGLKDHALNHIVSYGLKALFKQCGLYEHVSQMDILFRVVPRINAVGRLSKPDIAYNLMIEHDPDTAELIAQNLNEYNNERKRIQRVIEKEAEKIVRNNPERYEHGILLYNSEWSIGVVGIVASKLAETFGKPSVVIGKNGDILKGSGRSIDDINLKEILDLCKDMFEEYGGHSQAAGVSIKPSYIEQANTLFNKACTEYYQKHGSPMGIKYYDVEISSKNVSIDVARVILDNLYPYCSQYNPEPIFLLKDAIITDLNVFEKKDWRTLSFYAIQNENKTSLNFRMFSDKFGGEIEGRKADIYFTFPQLLGGKYNPSLNIVDIVFKN